MTRDHRRLAAIVSADVVGYSLLMGRDDSATLTKLKAHRRELIDPKITEYGGRIVKTIGDGLLLEFPSVVDAVRCAVDVQKGMAERNAGVPANERIEFRIGINIGDIIIDGDDIFGDGVNVAARLEALADPGGICVSRVVRDQVQDKLSFTFEDLGAQRVKNIARPVEVYQVALGPSTSRKSIGSRLSRLTRAMPGVWATAGLLAFGLAAVGAWWMTRSPGPAAAGPPSFSVAVLPFTALTDGHGEGALAESLTIDLTSALNRNESSSVVSSSLAATYKGKPVDARLLGRELNVRYLVEGVVRTAAERTSVKARLTDTSTGGELWSDDFDLDPAGDRESRQLFIGRLTNQVRSALGDSEARRIMAQPVASLNARDLSYRADFLQLREPQSLRVLAEASSLYDRALRLDPDLTDALMGQSLVVMATLDLDPDADHDRLVHELDEMSLRLIAVADRQARAWNFRADALQRQWRWDAALEANARAQKLDPPRTDSIGQRADILVDMGKPDEALATVDQALALQPGRAAIAGYLLVSRCRAYLALGRYDEAIAACEQVASLGDDWFNHAHLVAAYALKANVARAEAEKTKLLAQRPGFSIADFKALRISDVPAYLQQTETHLYAGLRKAGIPEK